MSRLLLLGTVTGAVIAGVYAAPVRAEGDAPATARADIIDLAGDTIGEARLTQGATGVLLYLRVEGLTPGAHGLHLHSRGICETQESFSTAMGHVDMVEGGHGLLNPAGPEAGDIPNIFVAADGIGEMEAYLTMVSLEEGAQNLLDADGSTIMIHENADDHVSQPIGGSGARVACGVIEAG
ncbi:superoxide dismutase family protein [Jannaschia marina]|uniref:superoxide dismutase family protein n=1 Tax=Jannaschia marina TaxID=2741674 RepID=UPI0015CB3726|nr:superoxide dismutase family protein [Jannaschia marina]